MPGVQPPFDAGFESIGTVVAVGDRVTRLKVGDAVLSGGCKFPHYGSIFDFIANFIELVFGAFAEYQLLDATKVSRIPAVDPSFLPLMGSGLTASLALQYSGHMTSGETVLVTGRFLTPTPKLTRFMLTHHTTTNSCSRRHRTVCGSVGQIGGKSCHRDVQ